MLKSNCIIIFEKYVIKIIIIYLNILKVIYFVKIVGIVVILVSVNILYIF